MVNEITLTGTNMKTFLMLILHDLPHDYTTRRLEVLSETIIAHGGGRGMNGGEGSDEEDEEEAVAVEEEEAPAAVAVEEEEAPAAVAVEDEVMQNLEKHEGFGTNEELTNIIAILKMIVSTPMGSNARLKSELDRIETYLGNSRPITRGFAKQLQKTNEL